MKKKIPLKAEIPTASMADIAFLMIIFFLLTTVFAREKGLQIVLPEKGEEVKIKKENLMNVLVNEEGQVKIGEEEVPLPEIKDKVRFLLSQNDSLVFTLVIDKRCKYDKVIKVFDQLKLADAERVAFAPPRGEEQ